MASDIQTTVCVEEFDIMIDDLPKTHSPEQVLLDLSGLTGTLDSSIGLTHSDDQTGDNQLLDGAGECCNFSNQQTRTNPKIPDENSLDSKTTGDETLSNEHSEKNVRHIITETGVGNVLYMSKEFSNILTTDKEPNEGPGEFMPVETEQDLQSENEADDAVSLDNILMADKPDQDSDGEFDFDLPVQQPSRSEVKVTTVPPVTMTTSQQIPPTAPVKPVGLVQPSPQILNIMKSTSVETASCDLRQQRVLEVAQQEWDSVTTIQAGYKDAGTEKGLEPTVIQTVKPMSPHELINILKSSDFSAIRPTVRTCVERRGFAAFINFLFGPPKMHRNLLDDRDRIFCIAATQLNSEDSSHMRTLQTIYRSLTGSKFDCARIGSHWEEIGFQGSDPGTDLRGAGMLGLLNLLYFLKDSRRQTLASDIYRLSLHPTQNFPFCVMGINLSRIVLQALRENVLNKLCNKEGDVFGVVNEFYVGLYLQLYLTWKQGKTISDSGFIIKDLEEKAKSHPADILKGLADYYKKKIPVIVGEKSTDLGTDDFVNVCEDPN